MSLNTIIVKVKLGIRHISSDSLSAESDYTLKMTKFGNFVEPLLNLFWTDTSSISLLFTYF